MSSLSFTLLSPLSFHTYRHSPVLHTCQSPLRKLPGSTGCTYIHREGKIRFTHWRNKPHSAQIKTFYNRQLSKQTTQDTTLKEKELPGRWDSACYRQGSLPTEHTTFTWICILFSRVCYRYKGRTSDSSHSAKVHKDVITVVKPNFNKFSTNIYCWCVCLFISLLLVAYSVCSVDNVNLSMYTHTVYCSSRTKFDCWRVT